VPPKPCPASEGLLVCELIDLMLPKWCKDFERVASVLDPKVLSGDTPIEFRPHTGGACYRVSVEKLQQLKARIPDGTDLDRACDFVSALADLRALQQIAPDHPLGDFVVDRSTAAALCPGALVACASPSPPGSEKFSDKVRRGAEAWQKAGMPIDTNWKIAETRLREIVNESFRRTTITEIRKYLRSRPL
jgi:hypothetical protein